MKLKHSPQTIQFVIEVLEREVKNYSEEFPPERIVKLKEYIKDLKAP